MWLEIFLCIVQVNAAVALLQLMNKKLWQKIPSQIAPSSVWGGVPVRLTFPSSRKTTDFCVLFRFLSVAPCFRSMSGMISGGHNPMGAAGTSPSTNDLASLIQA